MNARHDPEYPTGQEELDRVVGEFLASVEPRGEVCSTSGCIRGSFHKVPDECVT